jgi:uncharacterized membrane protein YphA (DoxX/SURF4 family)
MESLSIVCRFVLASIFVFVGIAKLARRQEFVLAVERYRLLPRPASRTVGTVIPWVETTVGVMLGIGLLERLTAVVLVGMLAVFAGAVAINLLRGRVIDCGCSGPGAPERITWRAVGRNIVFIAMGVLVALRAPPVLAVDALWADSHTSRLSDGSGVALLVVAVSIVAAVSLLRATVAAVRAERTIAAVVGGSL